MLSSLGCLLLCGSIALALGNAQKLPKGKRPNLKVHINTTSDSILLKFLRPNPDVKLEGFLLGYGSNLSPNQYFPLPAEGKYTEAVVDAEPKYLIVVRPAPVPSQKKSCSGKRRSRKPLQLVVGTLTPSSVFLSWGFLINPHHDWTLPSNCPNDRFYTIRYREKDKEKKWIFQLCPATETIVENLKPDTVYEFGVKDNVEGGIWSKIFNHKTIIGSINKVNGKIQSTYDQVNTVPAYVPRKLIPITIIKQVIQNVTHRASTKSPDKSPIGGTILVHLVIPGLNDTTVKLPTSIMFEISDAIKTQLAKNETLALPAESKTPKVEKIPAQPITASSEKPWTVPITKTSEDSKVLPPQTAPEPQTPTPSQSTIAPRKTKRPGRRPRPKTTPSPDVPKSKPALEPATVQPELLVPTIDSKPPKQLLPKPQTTAKPDVPSIKAAFKPVIVETDSPAISIVPATDIEPVTLRTEAPWTTIAPKTSRRPRTRRPRPPVPKPSKRKTTPSPEAPQTVVDIEPVTPGTSLAPTTTKRPRRPRLKPKTTPRPEVPQATLAPATIFEPVVLTTEAPGMTLAPATVLEPVTPIKEAPVTAFVPVTDLEPVTFTTETSGTTLATKPPKRPHRPRPRPKTTPSPQVPQTKPVPATVLEPVTLRPQAPGTTLASKPSQRTGRPCPRPKTTPPPEIPESKPVSTADFEPVTFRTEPWVTTQAPKPSKRTRRPRPKPKTTTTTEAPQTKLVPITDLEPGTPRTEVPEIIVLPTVLEPVALRTKAPETTLASAETDYVYPTAKAPLRPEEPNTEVVESITNVSEPPETTLAPKQIPLIPPKPKTSPHPRVPQTQQATKVLQRVTSKPKMSPKPEVSYTPPVPEVLLPRKPDHQVSQSEPVLQPVTFRIDLPEATIAPLETRGSPFIPMISPSPSQEELQSTLAPHRLHTAPVRPRVPDRPHSRPVLNKTTTRPGRPRPSGMPKGNGMGTGVKEMPLSADRNMSMNFTHFTKKPATIPGTRRPPWPLRPTPPRRKPLPPNNVTGKPGSAGIISSGFRTSPPSKTALRPTGAPSDRTEIDKKQPTAPASGEDLGDLSDFSSSPTRETDHLGKPRFKGPHVRYIPKPDNRPCSITDSIKRFPKEEATEGNATSPPQNPPSNLTVVTVEGCPSFVILDWDKPPNDTVTEYEVISRENGSFSGKNKSIQVTNQTFSTVENLKPDTSYEFQVKPKNPLGEGPASNTVAFSTESADPRVSEPVSGGRDAIWTERPFNSDSYSECKGKQYVKRTWYKKFVGVQLCNSLRYKIYLSDSLTGKFYNIGDQRGHGEDHCQFVDSFLDGRTGQQLSSDQLPRKEGYFRAVRQEPVQFGEIGGHTQINYVQWYECGTTIPGKW
ncbi:ABI family member 3 binding protein [Phyllostomus discolor]|uniref:ABI family member 3 binding protein n=1 Tax=Phyllostomus discolor TaxID=89673 RepID=A0A834AT97_9CHIR|nr:ABI family member 3 binding protein [Phyllostomus discolor]